MYQAAVNLGPNLYAMPRRDYDALRVSGEEISAFRFTDDGHHALLTRDPKKPLSEGEICKINLLCDKVEGAKNREVKSTTLSAIRSHFARTQTEFQLFEFGAGRHPLVKDVRSGKDEYHAIEIDRDIVAELNAKGISASTIETLDEGTLRTDKTRIAAGVYTLHFWDPEKAADDIKRVISQDGFFVANYMSSKRALDPEHGQKLLESLREQGLSVAIVEQGAKKKSQHDKSRIRTDENLGNEFWVVSYPPEKNGMRALSTKFADELVTKLPKSDDTYLKRTTYDAVKESDRSPQSLPAGPSIQ